MREHPILFQPDMVRAVLREISPKTQTRRLITARNSLVDGVGLGQKAWDAMGFDFSRSWVDPGPSPAGNPGPYLKVPAVRGGHETVHRIYPRVQPGNVLWGRESFQPLFAAGFDHFSADWETGIGYAVRYVATEGRTEWIDGEDNITDRCKPGIHMPRWACRLVLPVGRVGVERLQDISEADAQAEGCDPIETSYHGKVERTLLDLPLMDDKHPYRNGYALLWEQINGAGSWAANPPVWIYDFGKGSQP